MNEFIISLVKYTAIFVCMLYFYAKLLRIDLKSRDLFDILIFPAFSLVLYFATMYIKILVPIGLLIFGIAFLSLRFKRTVYETVTVGTIALSFSIVLYIVSFITVIPITFTLSFINYENLQIILAQLIVGLIQITCAFLLFKIKRFQSGVNPKSKTATFEILLFFSVGCIFAMMLFYTNQSLYEIVLLIITLIGLLLILWWRRHITYNYREAVDRQSVRRLEDQIDEYKSNYVEKDLQFSVYSKHFHFLNKTLPDCTLLAEKAAEQTGCEYACAARDILQRVLRELNLANIKCSLQNIPQTHDKVIDAPIIGLFSAAESKNFNVSADITADVESWFTKGELHKEDVHILLSYLCDNAMISALGSPNAKVRVELGATINLDPLIRIYDSGSQFDEKVLAKVGLEQITTRAAEGGSGIGLFTVFEILVKYGASFTLDEDPQIFGFSKFIEIAFDGRRSVSVRTCRKSVADVCAARKNFKIVNVVRSDTDVLRDGTNG